MSIDAIPIAILFVMLFVLVIGCIEIGYRLGLLFHRRPEAEKESPVSAITTSVLGLVGFMLAFTFGIVAQRYENRKGLLREQVNAIRTTYQRSDFLAEPDRTEARRLLSEYVADGVALIRAFQTGEKNAADVKDALSNEHRIQRRLWEMAVTNARCDMTQHCLTFPSVRKCLTSRMRKR